MANRPGVESTVSRLAAIVAVLVALGTPSAFLWHEFDQAAAYLAAEADLQAAAMTAFVGRNPVMWRSSTERLRAVVERSRIVKGAIRVMDREGRVIVDAGDSLQWPVLARQAEFFDFGTPVGVVEVSASGWNIIIQGGFVLAAGLVLGALIFGPLRRIPLRAFDAAMREIQSSEARYRALVENAPVGIVKHRHGTIEFANRAFVSLAGAESPGELVGRDLLDFVAAEHRGEAAGMVVALSAGPALQAMRRLHLLRRDGSIVETEVTGVASRERDVWLGQMIFVDVSEQRRAQELLRLSRDRLLEQQRVLSALARSEEFAAGGDAGVRLLTETTAKHMGVARVSLWRFAEGQSSLECVDLYDRASGLHSNGAVIPVQQYPRYFEAVASEEAIVADDAVNDELTRELADAYLRPHGVGSLLDIPLRVGGVVAGVLCHEHVGAPALWTPEERMFAIAAGSLATLALEREARRQAER